MNVKRKQPTAEQRERRNEIDARNRAIQKANIKPKHGNTFAGKPVEKKRGDR